MKDGSLVEGSERKHDVSVAEEMYFPFFLQHELLDAMFLFLFEASELGWKDGSTKALPGDNVFQCLITIVPFSDAQPVLSVGSIVVW